MKIVPLTREKISNNRNQNLKNKSTNLNQCQKNQNKYAKIPILSILNFTGNVEFQEKDNIDTKNLSDFLDRYYITMLKMGNMPNSILSVCQNDLFNQKYFRDFLRKNNLEYKEVISCVSVQNRPKLEYYDRIIQEAQKSKQEDTKTILGIDFSLIPLENGKIPQKYNDFFMNCAKEYNCTAFVHSDSICNIEKNTTLPFDIAVFLDSKTNKSLINKFMKFKDTTPIYTTSTSKLARMNKKINSLLSNLSKNYSKNEKESLSDNQLYIGNSMTVLSNFSLSTSELNPSALKKVTVLNTPLVDFWLDLSGEDSTKYTSRLKNEWLDSVLKDPNKTSSLISQTLDKLQEENALIEAARTAYRDIIENEDEITPEQKEMLIQQQDSKLFFQVVSNNLKPDDSIKLQLNTIETIRQLSKEKEEVKANARENIFDPARKLELEDEDSSDIVGYIFDLLNQKAISATQEEKDELKSLVESFEQAKDSGDTDEFNSIWQKLINIAQEYFETDELDNLTNTNIILLDSINKNMKDEKNQRIISLVNNPNLSVEQREFVSRYKDDKNFRLMINNPNVDSFSAIENLVYFEAGNKNLIQEAGLNYSDNDFKKIMSDKFHQIDKEAKDINIQGDRIVAKLGELNSSVNEFANGFSVYANSSLENQAKQLEQMYISNDLLSSIDKNTQEIKAYTQAQVRAKLVELEKDKYYKDIVPEITKLLPEDEQINLKDFLSKVDDLVKNEKDTKRKKAILTAAAVVAGTAIAAAAIYYVGPTVVAHLASKLPQGASAAQALTSTMGLVNKAKLLGNSKLIRKLSFTATGAPPNSVKTVIEILKPIHDPKATKALNEITSIINTTGTISITETQNILNNCGINIDV